MEYEIERVGLQKPTGNPTKQARNEQLTVDTRCFRKHQLVVQRGTFPKSQQKRPIRSTLFRYPKRSMAKSLLIARKTEKA